MTRLHAPDLTLVEPCPADEEATEDSSAVLGGTLLTVDAHEVEHGDIIFGLRTPITSILTEGVWWYYGGGDGTFIAKRRSGSRLLVWRADDLAGDEPADFATGDAPASVPGGENSPGGPPPGASSGTARLTAEAMPRATASSSGRARLLEVPS